MRRSAASVPAPKLTVSQLWGSHRASGFVEIREKWHIMTSHDTLVSLRSSIKAHTISTRTSAGCSRLSLRTPYLAISSTRTRLDHLSKSLNPIICVRRASLQLSLYGAHYIDKWDNLSHLNNLSVLKRLREKPIFYLSVIDDWEGVLIPLENTQSKVFSFFICLTIQSLVSRVGALFH